MKILDLFSGTKSLKKPGEDLGHFFYFTIDSSLQFNPDMCIDIAILKSKDIPFMPDFIWASPPCKTFSVASISKHWNKNKTPRTKECRDAISLIQNVIKIINELNPKFWYIENPVGMLRNQEFMRKLPIMRTVTYCQYGENRMKPTDIWTNNLRWNPKPRCSPGDNCHEAAPRGSRTGTQAMTLENRWKVPYDLLYEIIIASNIKSPTN